MRWIERTIRSHWAFTATPLRIQLKADPPRRNRRNAFAKAGPTERVVKVPKRRWAEMQKPVWQRKTFIEARRQQRHERAAAANAVGRAGAIARTSGAREPAARQPSGITP